MLLIEGKHDKAFEQAVASGCEPFWYNGQTGPAWHCNCDNEDHFFDSQCSVLKFYKPKEK